MLYPSETHLNTLRSRQNGRHFADDTFKYIFLNDNVIISAKISQKFVLTLTLTLTLTVPKDPINDIPALVQIMAWRRPGDKPLSEPMMVRLPTHICVTRPQWVKLKSHKFCLLITSDVCTVEISVITFMWIDCQIVLKFYTEQRAPSQYSKRQPMRMTWTNARFKFKMRCRKKTYISKSLRATVLYSTLH